MARVQTRPPVGKVTPELFAEVIFERLGAEDEDVLVRPQHGVDFGIVRVAPGTVMALTSDPVFVVPAYGWRRAAWFAAHILASDAATSGLPLRWMAVDLNLPPDTSDEDAHTARWRGSGRNRVQLRRPRPSARPPPPVDRAPTEAMTRTGRSSADPERASVHE